MLKHISWLTWYKGLRYPHGEVPADAKHAAREDVGGAADDSHTGQRADQELQPTAGHVHLHQHRGRHKHHQDDKKGRQDAHIWRQPTGIGTQS